MLPQGTFSHREFHRSLLNQEIFIRPPKQQRAGQFIDETLPIAFLEPGGK